MPMRPAALSVLVLGTMFVGGTGWAEPLARAESVTLSPGRADVRLGEGALGTRLKTVGPNRRLFLQLQSLKAEQSPGVTYNVYLNLPDGRAPQGVADPHYLGTFSFFDTEGRSRSLEIDVTGKLRRLAADGKIGADATITIVPAGQPSADARPRIGAIAITAR